MAKKCSVQSGSTSSTATAFTQTLATPVDMSKSFLVFTVRSGTNANYETLQMYVGGALTSTNQISFYRTDNASGSHTIIVDWFVVSFSSDIFVQRGVDDATSTVTNKTLTSINTAKSFVQQSVLSANASNFEQMRDYSVRSNISSSTNLALDAGSANPVRTYWQVIEYQKCTVEKYLLSSGTLTTDSVSILSVTMNKTLITHTGKATITGNFESVFWHFYLASTTQLALIRVDPNGVPYDFLFYVVSFSEDVTVNRYAVAVPLTTNTVNQPVSVSSLDTAFIIGHDHANQSLMTRDDYVSRISCGKRFSSTTNVIVQREATVGGANGTTYFEVIDYTQEGRIPDMALFLTAMH